MEDVMKKSGTTTPAKVKSLLFLLANSVGRASAISGGMERTGNEINCHFVVDGGAVLSINIQDIKGGAL